MLWLPPGLARTKGISAILGDEALSGQGVYAFILGIRLFVSLRAVSFAWSRSEDRTAVLRHTWRLNAAPGSPFSRGENRFLLLVIHFSARALRSATRHVWLDFPGLPFAFSDMVMAMLVSISLSEKTLDKCQLRITAINQQKFKRAKPLQIVPLRSLFSSRKTG